MQEPTLKEPRIRWEIKKMVEDGISPTSIVFSVGRIVTPDEAAYLRSYEEEYVKKNK